MTTEATTPAGDAPAATPATPADATTAPAAVETPTPVAAPEVTPEVQALIDAAATKASRAANAEAVKAKAELAKLQKAEEDRQTAALSDAERLQKERDDAVKAAELAQANARALTVNAAVERAAAAAGFADPTDALTLAATITLDDAGQPVGVSEAVAALLAAKPHYAGKPGTPSLDPTNGARQQGADQPVSDAQRLAALRNPSAGNIFGRRR